MRTGALFQRYELFVAAATIGAHANASQTEFRQRDVRFLIELFSNWVEISFQGSVLELSNTQVQRYLDDLSQEGYARRVMKKRRPYYRLTRVGLIELLTRIIPGSEYIQPEHFFFLYYFVHNYRPRLLGLVKEEGRQFPPALKLELDALLDTESLVQNQISHVDFELRKLETRIDDSMRGGKLAKKLFMRGDSTTEVSKQIEEKYPYELNTQKPLSELFSEIPPDIGRWELEEGVFARVSQMWEPQRVLLQNYRRLLKRLKEEL